MKEVFQIVSNVRRILKDELALGEELGEFYGLSQNFFFSVKLWVYVNDSKFKLYDTFHIHYNHFSSFVHTLV